MTTTRIVVAIIVTACLFALSLRDLHVRPRSTRPWFELFDGGGWALAANVAFYGWICWMAFWWIRGTKGRERLLTVCWFSIILTEPLVALGREWSIALDYVDSATLGVALCAAVSMLFEKRGDAASVNTPEA